MIPALKRIEPLPARRRLASVPESEGVLDVQAEIDKIGAWEMRARACFERGRHDQVACLLSELVGPTLEVPISIPAYLRGEMTPCNPSVCVHDGRRLAVVRGVNYRQAPDKRTLFVTRKNYCWTDDWWVEFDRDWSVRDVRLMVDPMPQRPGSCQGYEDCRLFRAADGFYASCTIAERPQLIGPMAFKMLLREMAILKISDEGLIEGVAAVRGPWSPYHQKNWRPICDGGQPRWIYASEPLTVVTAADKRAPDGLRWWPWGPWRGSSQAVRVGDNWLWVDHRMIEDVAHLGNVYVHRFVLADSKLTRIVSTSRPFIFKGYGVEFCAGLALDGSNAVLSYSTRDANALLAIVSLESVLSAARAN